MTPPRPSPHRGGMTLVEMLVAMMATLIVMAAVAQIFAAFGGAISNSRAVLELDAQMRSAAWRLRSDLAGATARPLPPLSHDAGQGYLEIIEGPAKDADAAHGATVGQADHDDVLLLTTRAIDAPFIGMLRSGTTVESTLAEVGWFARPTANTSNPVTFTLYRKQLLVMGYVGTGTTPFAAASFNRQAWSTYGSWSAYFSSPCDVSARLEGGMLYPNTIADLTRRESRFLHDPDGIASFPFAFVDHQATPPASGLIFDSASRQGEDVVLTNVLAFDIRVFDPTAPVAVPGSTPLVPGDPGFTAAPVASGAYVDLGNGVTANSLLRAGTLSRFGGLGNPRSKLDGTATSRRTYDTWSTHYEANGVDEDNDSTPDEGTNGLDDDGDGTFDEPAADSDGDGVIDDVGETETLPPYPWPLRGIEVRIRCYEPTSRQLRQVTVRHTFVPQ